MMGFCFKSFGAPSYIGKYFLKLMRDNSLSRDESH